MPELPLEFHSSNSSSLVTNSVERVANALGDLPKSARYFDEYTEKIRSIDSRQDIWKVEANGRRNSFDFSTFDETFKPILKHFGLHRLQKNAVTGTIHLVTLLATRSAQLELISRASADPMTGLEFLRAEYSSKASELSNSLYFSTGKAILYFFVELGVAGWSPAHGNILRTVRSPIVRSKLRSVRDRSAVLDLSEERQIIDHLDDLSSNLRKRGETNVDLKVLRDTAILMCCFQHGVRPIQIANRNITHARVRASDDGQWIVHITFRYAKQRSRQKVQEQTRKIKRDWAPILVAWLRGREQLGPHIELDRKESLFGVSPGGITKIVGDLTESLTGIRRTPYELRHTAAQRKADAGCTRLELAEFLMHSDIDTADAYIEMSPTQAEKINAALGLSPLFQAIDKALKSRSVNIDELRKLPEDKQISGAPHGHLVAGIGGCAIGQSFCPKTPALACYDCHKFMYLRDVAVHKAARDSIRSIVTEFVGTSKGDNVTPAYGQLRRVLETIEAIITDLEGAEASQ